MIHEPQHFSGRLVSVIENHAQKLAQDTVKKLQSSPRTTSYQRLSHAELSWRVSQVYENLGRWLWQNTEHAIQAWYNELGEKRFNESIPLDEVLWALNMTKHQLMDYLDACALADSAIELYRLKEFDRLVGQFFDRAVCYAAEGYEREACLRGRDGAATTAH